MTLGSTQPLTEMSTRNLPGGVKGGGRVRLTAPSPSVSRVSRKYGSLDVLQPYGPSRSVAGIIISNFAQEMRPHYYFYIAYLKFS
jgi:hypothetical protein